MIKKLMKYYFLRESVKEIELNRILDKISQKDKLSEREFTYLQLYNHTVEDDLKDYMLLSKAMACDKISYYIDKKKKVYCDAFDRNGKISELITHVDKSKFKLKLKHGGEYQLDSRYLYNIIYKIKKDEYSFECQGEYFEEVTVCT